MSTFGNLETSILDVREFEGYPDSGAEDWGLTGLPAVAEDLVEMGFDLLSRANNHALDWGIAGMRETSRWLDEAELVHAGTGENRGLARAPQYYESDKGRIGLVSMVSTYKASSAATPALGSTSGRPGVNALRVARFTTVPPEAMSALVGLQRAMDQARGKHADEVVETAVRTLPVRDRVPTGRGILLPVRDESSRSRGDPDERPTGQATLRLSRSRRFTRTRQPSTGTLPATFCRNWRIWRSTQGQTRS